MSSKSRTCRRWIPSDKYCDNYDNIFGKKEEPKPKVNNPLSIQMSTVDTLLRCPCPKCDKLKSLEADYNIFKQLYVFACRGCKETFELSVQELQELGRNYR